MISLHEHQRLVVLLNGYDEPFGASEQAFKSRGSGPSWER